MQPNALLIQQNFIVAKSGCYRKPFLKLVRATIDKKRGIINMKVDRVHEKFIYHPKNFMCYCQI
jgi:hypothetical protein